LLLLLVGLDLVLFLAAFWVVTFSVLFVLDGAESPVVGEAAQPAAVHCGHPAGEVFILFLYTLVNWIWQGGGQLVDRYAITEV
jgi:hypothetical protein